MMESLLILNANPAVHTFSTTFRPNPTRVPYSGIHRQRQSMCKGRERAKWFSSARYGDSMLRAPKRGNWREKERRDGVVERGSCSRSGGEVGRKQMLLLCGFGYWMQGFRCFPWLALNFHMANNLNFEPATLQLVQNSGNLPMVAKPLYGILSDALCIGGGHRVPYVSIGVALQVLSWGPLAAIPFVGGTLPTLLSCVLLSNIGAAITEVAQDAIVAEYGQKHRLVGLQSYTFMAIAVAGVLGNSLGGIMLTRTHARTILLVYAGLLLAQLVISFGTREDSLGLSRTSAHDVEEISVSDSVKLQFSGLLVALSDKNVLRPLIWIVTSISVVPILSGTIFCYQAQFLGLDSTIIGLSRVASQMVLLFLTILYDRVWKDIPLRKLISITQLVYASTLLLDLILVKQANVSLALMPLLWIHYLPSSGYAVEKERKAGMSKKYRRNRRIGRVVFNSMFSYRRDRESEA
ncbi:putative folate-biopterin transporter 9, chloroplastic [Drosera capensis]